MVSSSAKETSGSMSRMSSSWKVDDGRERAVLTFEPEGETPGRRRVESDSSDDKPARFLVKTFINITPFSIKFYHLINRLIEGKSSLL